MLLDENSFDSIVKETRLADKSIQMMKDVFVNNEKPKEVAEKFNVSVQHVNTLKTRFMRKIEEQNDVVAFMSKNKPRLAQRLLEDYETEILKLREAGYTLEQILSFLKEKDVTVAMSTLSIFLREKS